MSVRTSPRWSRAQILTGALLVTACSGDPAGDAERIAQPGAPGAVTLTGGFWFDGESFAERTVHVEDGIFVEELSGPADSIVDLAGGYVVPPFGDAHTHMLDGGAQQEALVRQYEADGIYYVQSLGGLSTGAAEARSGFGQPGRLDVLYANGGLTSTLGHPFIAYEPRAMGLGWREALQRQDEVRSSRRMEGNAYWFMDTPEEVDLQWTDILATEPDLLKIFLLRARDPDHPADPDAMGLTGLSPEVAARVMERAEEAGLPVWAHVETADDMRLGLELGVQGFAHLPGYALEADDPIEPYRLPQDVVERAGELGVAFTPTATLVAFYTPDDSTRIARVRELMRDAIARLRAAGATLLIGTDSYGTTSAREAWVLATELLDPATVVDLWSRVTPQTMYPGRRIGRLAPGWEASFVVLEGDPTRDFAHAGAVRFGMKQGVWIQPTRPSTISSLAGLRD